MKKGIDDQNNSQILNLEKSMNTLHIEENHSEEGSDSHHLNSSHDHSSHDFLHTTGNVAHHVADTMTALHFCGKHFHGPLKYLGPICETISESLHHPVNDYLEKVVCGTGISMTKEALNMFIASRVGMAMGTVSIINPGIGVPLGITSGLMGYKLTKEIITDPIGKIVQNACHEVFQILKNNDEIQIENLVLHNEDDDELIKKFDKLQLEKSTINNFQYEKLKLLSDHTIAQESFKQAELLFLKEKYQEALEIITMATELNPSYALGQCLQGSCFRELGKLPEALESYKKAIQLDPNSGFFVTNLSKAYAKLNNPTQKMNHMNEITGSINLMTEISGKFLLLPNNEK